MMHELSSPPSAAALVFLLRSKEISSLHILYIRGGKWRVVARIFGINTADVLLYLLIIEKRATTRHLATSYVKLCHCGSSWRSADTC